MGSWAGASPCMGGCEREPGRHSREARLVCTVRVCLSLGCSGVWRQEIKQDCSVEVPQGDFHQSCVDIKSLHGLKNYLHCLKSSLLCSLIPQDAAWPFVTELPTPLFGFQIPGYGYNQHFLRLPFLPPVYL